MPIYFQYALVSGVVLGLLVLVGGLISNRYFILTGMIFSAIIASPVTSFTRGAAGAIYASDIVAIFLLICWFLPSTKTLLFSVTPKWYRCFFWFMIIAILSTSFISPFFTTQLAEAGLIENVRSPIPGIPLPILMAGFRIIRIIFHLTFFSYACHLLIDEKSLRFVYKAILFSIVALGICQIIMFLGIKDMGLYIPGFEYQGMHIVGHAKSAAGRLYLIGIFICLILLYRSWSTWLYLAALGTITMALLFLGSRAGFAGVLIGIFMLALRARWGGKVLVILLIMAMPIAFSALAGISPERIAAFKSITIPTENPRWEIWGWVVKSLFSRIHIFITGLGFSNFRYAVAGETQIQHAHNDILTCLAELGLIGLFAYLLCFYTLARELFSRIKYNTGKIKWEAICMSSLFTAFLVTSMFESTLYYSAGITSMQRIFAVLFGTYTAWWVQQDYETSWEYEFSDDSFSEEEYYLLQDSEVLSHDV